MLVPYKLTEIPGKGLGVIALTFIPKGTRIYNIDGAGVEVRIHNENEFEDYLSKNNIKDISEIRKIINHAYGWQGSVRIVPGDAKFVNHDINANYGEDDCATRDIQKGEEICDNYLKYESFDWFEKVASKYGAQTCMSFAINHEKNKTLKNKLRQIQMLFFPICFFIFHFCLLFFFV